MKWKTMPVSHKIATVISAVAVVLWLIHIISAVLVLGVLVGIGMMSKVNTARMGNLLSALCTVAAIADGWSYNAVYCQLCTKSI